MTYYAQQMRLRAWLIVAAAFVVMLALGVAA
jgi:hypothetical protein